MPQRGYYQPPTQFSVFPPVLKNLLILNALVFFAQMVPTTDAFLIRWAALWPPGTPEAVRTAFGGGIQPGEFWPWQLVTYGFLHGSFGHILFNMFALWMFGIQIENTWGSRRFAVYYFVCVIGAGIVQAFVMWGQPVPTLGASGGVFGVLLAFGMMFPNQRIYIYFLFPVKAKWLVLGLAVLELYWGVSGGQAGVANFAHLGGAAVGFAMIQFWRGKLPVQPKHRMRW